MRPIRVTVGSQAASNPIPMDQYQSPFNVGVGVSLTAGASLTYSVQHTFDNVFAAGYDASTGNWFDNSGLTAKTASDDGNYAFAVSAIRLNVTTYASGSATMVLLQSGVQG